MFRDATTFGVGERGGWIAADNGGGRTLYTNLSFGQRGGTEIQSKSALGVPDGVE